MRQFKALGKMTGGRDVEYMQINASTLQKILEDVRNHGLSEYVVGFAPLSAAGCLRQHQLEIKLAYKSKGAWKVESEGRTIEPAASNRAFQNVGRLRA
jgi:hypothetical protein